MPAVLSAQSLVEYGVTTFLLCSHTLPERWSYGACDVEVTDEIKTTIWVSPVAHDSIQLWTKVYEHTETLYTLETRGAVVVRDTSLCASEGEYVHIEQVLPKEDLSIDPEESLYIVVWVSRDTDPEFIQLSQPYLSGRIQFFQYTRNCTKQGCLACSLLTQAVTNLETQYEVSWEEASPATQHIYASRINTQFNTNFPVAYLYGALDAGYCTEQDTTDVGGLTFDRTAAQYIHFGEAPQYEIAASAFSLEAWVKPEPLPLEGIVKYPLFTVTTNCSISQSVVLEEPVTAEVRTGWSFGLLVLHPDSGDQDPEQLFSLEPSPEPHYWFYLLVTDPDHIPPSGFPELNEISGTPNSVLFLSAPFTISDSANYHYVAFVKPTAHIDDWFVLLDNQRYPLLPVSHQTLSIAAIEEAVSRSWGSSCYQNTSLDFGRERLSAALPGDYFAGKARELRVYQRALTMEEAVWNRNRNPGPPVMPECLVLHAPLVAQTGNDVAGSSPAYTATLYTVDDISVYDRNVELDQTVYDGWSGFWQSAAVATSPRTVCPPVSCPGDPVPDEEIEVLLNKCATCD
ncbi:MAG: hypothetical protein KF690_02105 [Bacteroidetes bacterium]|nr:hypothetical protein [Bacteroidota bacterium]